MKTPGHFLLVLALVTGLVPLWPASSQSASPARAPIRNEIAVTAARLAAHPHMHAVEFRIKAPASDAQFATVQGKLAAPIPGDLRRLYADVASEVLIEWELEEGKEIKVENESLGRGGGLLWCLDNLPDLLKAWAVWSGDRPAWQGKFPFMRLANGDFLAIEQAPAVGGKVWYLSHEDDAEETVSFALDCTLTQFLHDWSQLGFIGPEWWDLEPFVTDGPAKGLDIAGAHAQVLRKGLRLE